MYVRRAWDDELDACAALYERVAGSLFDWAPQEDLTAVAIRPSFDLEEVYIALQDGALTGFLSFYRPGNFVHSLFVERRGCGAGTALLAHMSDVTEGPPTLKCSELNLEAMAFYLNRGWTEIERGDTDGLAWRRLRARLTPAGELRKRN